MTNHCALIPISHVATLPKFLLQRNGTLLGKSMGANGTWPLN